MDVLKAIKNGDTIIRITVEERWALTKPPVVQLFK
jgi:hypothetical protein